MVHIDVNTIFTSELQFCLKYLATAIPSPNIPVDIMMLIQADRECKLAGRKFVNTVDGVDGQGKLRVVLYMVEFVVVQAARTTQLLLGAAARYLRKAEQLAARGDDLRLEAASEGFIRTLGTS